MRIIDSDPQFELLMKKYNLNLDMDKLSSDEILTKDALRDFARDIKNRDLKYKLENALGIVYPTLLSSRKIRILKQDLKDYGYDTFLIFIVIPLDEALRRNKRRERAIPRDILIEEWRKTQEEYARIAGDFKGNSIVLDGTKEVSQYNLEVLDKFLNSDIKNTKANNWINVQLELKKIQ